MRTKKLKVDQWLTEASRSLNWNLTSAINNKLRIHISAPTGAGKTMYFIDRVEKLWKDHTILVLAPLNAIGEYINIELQKRGIRTYIFNSDTKKKLTDEDLEYPILSTIDSAYKLFDPSYSYSIDTSKLIVFIDETHVLIQDGKHDYDKSIRAILKTGCPVIGFSATPDGWVTKHLFKMDKLIEVATTKRAAKRIVPIKVKYGMAATIAGVIIKDKLKKVVIFTTNPAEQEKIKDEIISLDPTKKCLVLNRPNKMDDEKDAWDHFMKHSVFPPGVDILLMNKVAQAGININDTDIDAVLLVGKFDPYGFLQYLGRCRNYRKSFYFLYLAYGTQTSLPTDADEYEDYISTMEQVIDLLKDSEIDNFTTLNTLFGNRFSEMVDGKSVLNKCVLVNDRYEEFKELKGEAFINFLPKFDPTLEIDEPYIFEGVDSSINTSRKRRRRKSLEKQIPEQIAKYAAYIYPIINYLKIGMTHTDALGLILKSKQNKAEAKQNFVIYIPSTRVAGMKKLFKNAKEVGMGVPKIIVAAKKYLDNGKDKQFIHDVLKESNPRIVKVLKAYIFYHQKLYADPLVKSTIKDMKELIGDKMLRHQWESSIKRKVIGIPGANHYVEYIYYCCLKLKEVQRVVNGKRKKLKMLDKVITSYPEYIKENNLDGIF